MNVSAVLVTRGNLTIPALSNVLESMSRSTAVSQIVVWNNAKRDVDLGVYGRYRAIDDAEHDLIYVQDDDCIVDVDAVIRAWEPGRLVANMPRSRWYDYRDSTLVGWGAVFPRELPAAAFQRFFDADPREATRLPSAFRRDCDLVFSSLTPRTVIDVGFEHLPWAETPGRLFKEPGHALARDAILTECRRIRTWDDDDKRAW